MEGAVGVASVTRLYHVEDIDLDRDRQVELVRDLPEIEADRLLGRALEEIAARLTRIETSHAQGDLNRVQSGARGLAAIADQTGLISVRRLALLVADLCRSRDSAALAANVARLIRVGEMSLVTVWDVNDISL